MNNYDRLSENEGSELCSRWQLIKFSSFYVDIGLELILLWFSRNHSVLEILIERLYINLFRNYYSLSLSNMADIAITFRFFWFQRFSTNTLSICRKIFLEWSDKSKCKWVWQNLFYSFLQLKYQFFALGVKFELTKVTYIY